MSDGTGTLPVAYRLERIDGQSEVSDGTLAAPTSVRIELNGMAVGPAKIKLDVYVEGNGIPDRQWIATCSAIPDKDGKYLLDATNLGKVTHEFIAMLNKLDSTYSASHLVAPALVSLNIGGDDPNLNTAPVFLERVLTITPQFRNKP